MNTMLALLVVATTSTVIPAPKTDRHDEKYIQLATVLVARDLCVDGPSEAASNRLMLEMLRDIDAPYSVVNKAVMKRYKLLMGHLNTFRRADDFCREMQPVSDALNKGVAK